MPSLRRRFHLAVLLAVLLAALPAARPALAQTFTVNSLESGSDAQPPSCAATCTLRDAIRLANANNGPDTIAFSFAGPGPHTIAPSTALPALTGDGTTIDGTNLATGQPYQVVLSGVILSAGRGGHGLLLRGNNIEVRNLVIGGFGGPIGDGDFFTGSGIFIDGTTGGGDNNRIYNNRIGVTADGATAFGNSRYGVRLGGGASNNQIGAAPTAGGSALGNQIAANGVANVGVGGAGETSTNSGNVIAGNLVGTNADATGKPVNTNTDSTQAGINVDTGASGTIIADNVIGGMTAGAGPNPEIAGIYVAGFESTPNVPGVPTGTRILRNFVGVNRGGAPVPNRVGIRVGSPTAYGPYDTVIGDPANPAGGRNIVAGNTQRGIEIRDTGFKFGDVTIAGNYVGLDAAGAPKPNGVYNSNSGGEGLFVGSYNPAQGGANPRVTVGPGNVISANITFGVRFRSGGHLVRGNFFSTNVEGTSSQLPLTVPSFQARTANAAPSIWIENGNGITIGGPSPADRNVIGFGSSDSGRVGAGVLIDPEGSGTNRTCDNGPCSTGGHTISNNYIGVAVGGGAALNSTVTEQAQREGIRLFGTSGNTISNNVIAGTGIGIALGGIANRTNTPVEYRADNNTISDNKIGTRASGITTGALDGIRNREEGIRLLSGSGNTIARNLIAYNGASSVSVSTFHGILVGSAATTADNNTVSTNRLVRNGDFGLGDGIRVDTADRIRITRTETFRNEALGINLVNGGNTAIGAPTITGVAAGATPTASGTLPAACDGCTVEIFASATSEVGEGPSFIASGQAAGSSFSIPVPGCLRFLTATVTDGNGNTSPFSAVFDSGATGPCTPELTLVLDAATPATAPGSPLNVGPGASATFTHRLTHNAQVERTYTIQITSTLGWASAPALVTIPAAPAGGTASTTFEVVVGVPAGTPSDTTDTTTVRAYFSPTLSSQERSNYTRARVATPNPAAPAVSPGQTKPFVPALVTFTHQVTNTGDLEGTFEVRGLQVVGSPPGFSATAAFGKTVLAGRESTTLTISVATPADAPAPGNVVVRFAVGVAGGPQTPDVEDTIVVGRARSFTFTPAEPQTRTTPAGAEVTFEYVLTNTGNAADSFSVTGATTGSPNPLTVVGVSATPGLVDLPAGASATVRVTFRVPPGTQASPPSYGVQVTAEATGGTNPPAAITRTGTVNVTGGGAALITVGPGTPDPVDVRAASGTVVFVNTVTNTGNAAVPIAVPATFTAGLPAGWTATTTATTCDDTPTIAPGATCTFTVSVSVPQGADAGAYSVPVTVTAVNSGLPAPTPPDVVATASVVVNVLRVRGVDIAPDRAFTGRPGELVTFTHTLTNTGNGTDSFTLAVAATSPGWSPLVTPTAVLNLARGATRQVTVTARVPAAVEGGTVNTLTVTAAVQGGAEQDTATDTITVATITAADLSPGQRRNVDAGKTVTYTHTLTNTGTTLRAFGVLNGDSAPGWSSTVSVNPSTPLAPGARATVTVAVTAPAAATTGVSNTTTLRVVESGTTTPVLDSEQDVTSVGPVVGVLITPDNRGVGFPNSTAVFTHTLTNIGASQGLFSLSVAESNGWPAQVTPGLVNLGGGQSITVQVRVSIPGNVRADEGGVAAGFARVTAQLVGDATVRDDATNTITVGRVVAVDLSASQLRAVNAGGPPQSLSNLAVNNRGNSFDTFDLTTSGVPAGWVVRLTPSTAPVDKDSTFRVNVEVTVPPNVEPRTVATVRVEARSRADNSVRDSVDLTLVYSPPERTLVYLPMVRQ